MDEDKYPGDPLMRPVATIPPGHVWPERLVATYDYRDAEGRLLYQILRYTPKFFATRHPLPDGGWLWDTIFDDTVLYNLPEVIAAQTIFVVEGEKDVETVRRIGLPEGWAATTNPYGATRWLTRYAEVLAGKTVYICADADDFGAHLGQRIAVSLYRHAEAVYLVDVPPPHKDISDWADAEGLAANLAALIATARRSPIPLPDEDHVDAVAPIAAPVERLLALRGVEFEWRDTHGLADMEGRQLGFVAQQVAPLEPGWVEPDGEGMQHLATRGFEALAVEALRSLAQEIAAAEARLAAIERPQAGQ